MFQENRSEVISLLIIENVYALISKCGSAQINEARMLDLSIKLFKTLEIWNHVTYVIAIIPGQLKIFYWPCNFFYYFELIFCYICIRNLIRVWISHLKLKVWYLKMEKKINNKVCVKHKFKNGIIKQFQS